MGRRTALYVSSAIGLGHVTRDLAIARELRRIDPEIDILWVAAPPASGVLRDAGERLLPESGKWRGTTGVAERCARDGSIDLVRYAYLSLSTWARNALVFLDIVKSHHVDIAVGDEAFEVHIPLVMRLMHPRVPFVMIFDFVGIDAQTRGVLDRFGAWMLNALWSADAGVYGRRRCSAIFIGEIDDVPDGRFGWALADRRRHVRDHYDVVGHAITFQPEEYADRAALRRRLGFEDGPLVVCSAGGTSIGRELLEMCAGAAAPLRAALPEVRVLLVCGPRIPVESVRAPQGVEVRGYVPRLYELFACCDVAVVQCGGTSTTELAALGTPFVYFPIEGHFEQETIAARLARHGIGRRMSLASTTPELLAQAVEHEFGRDTSGVTMPLQGTTAAARHILSALGDGGGGAAGRSELQR